MPTTTDHPPAEDTAAGASGRTTLGSKISAFAIVVASIATLVILFMMLRSVNDDSPRVVQAIPAPDTSAPSQAPRSEPSVAAPLPPPAPAREPEVRAAPVEPASPSEPAQAPQAEAPVIDELGFVDSEARCGDDQHAVAIARTEASAVVICRDDDGDYVYQGVRLRDGASLTLDDVRPMPAGFEARNGSTTYRLSASELVVIDGETLYTREPVVEYQAG